MTAPLVLVADDCRTLQVITRRYLEAIGCRCVITSNAEDAFKQAGGLKFDLMIFDLQMPGQDGRELLARIRRPENINSQTPHLFISSANSSTLNVLGISGDEVIIKPIAEEVFRARVSAALASQTENAEC